MSRSDRLYAPWAAVTAALAALVLAGTIRAQAPAATSTAPLAAAPAEPAAPPEAAADEVPVMLREYKEVREYKGVPIEFDMKARTQMTRILNDGKFTQPEDAKIFDGAYLFRVAELTWNENLTDLPKKRGNFKTRDLAMCGKAPDQEVHTLLNKKLLEMVSNIAISDEYHPAVRYNCMLLIGQLDQIEPAINGTGAVPLPEALVRLKQAAGDPKQIDAVRIAAMDGIVRHCELSVAEPVRRELAPMLEAIIADKKPSPVGTRDGQLWLRHRASQALAEMAAKWPEANRPEALAAFQQLLADEEAAFMFRADAAYGIGALEKTVFKNSATLRDVSMLLGQLAIGIATKAPVTDAGDVNREHLTYCLLHTNSAIKGHDPARGLAAAATEPSTRKFVVELAGKIDGLMSTANDKKAADADRANRLNDEAGRLNDWLEKSRTTLARP